MATNPATLPPGEALLLTSLLVPPPGGIASRVLAKTPGGSVTLFAFDAGQGLTEHTSPFDALVVGLDGRLGVTVAGVPAEVGPGAVVRLPAGVPHGVDAPEASRMLLVMLRDASA